MFTELSISLDLNDSVPTITDIMLWNTLVFNESLVMFKA